MKPEIRKGIYKHYKGKFYEVLHLAIHSETLEAMVVYKPLYKSDNYDADTLWVRPLTMFTEKVVVDGKLVDRFSFQKTSIDN